MIYNKPVWNFENTSSDTRYEKSRCSHTQYGCLVLELCGIQYMCVIYCMANIYGKLLVWCIQICALQTVPN